MNLTTNETLAVGSIEGFLSSTERQQILSSMEDFFDAKGRDGFANARTSSLHEIPGKDVAFAKATYEPSGRLEVLPTPEAVSKIMAIASARTMSHVRRLVPSVQEVRPWTYVEYGNGQFITAHIDHVAPSPQANPLQLLGVSVTLNDDYEGGEFYVETTGSECIWSNQRIGALQMVYEGGDVSSDWFNNFSRTRWTTKPNSGTALFYGSQVVHGTLPVTKGTVRKLISWYACSNKNP